MHFRPFLAFLSEKKFLTLKNFFGPCDLDLGPVTLGLKWYVDLA